MAKSNNPSSLWSEMFAVNLYKRNQGRLTRQISAVTFATIVFFGAWTLSQGPLAGFDQAIVHTGIPLLVAALGAWGAFRAVNYPRFADFLISVQAEVDKVSWASKEELYRATVVVVVTMFFLGFTLLAFDVIWQWFFRLIGVLQF
jgi:preprotein translocase subunit SecE